MLHCDGHTRRRNLHGRVGGFIVSRGTADASGMPFMNQAPSSRQCMRCWRTNSYDSLYSFALRLLQGTQCQRLRNKRNWSAKAHRTGILLMMSSSISSSFICLSRTARYSHSRNSCSTSCHGRMFSRFNATLTLKTNESVTES